MGTDELSHSFLESDGIIRDNHGELITKSWMYQ